MGKVWFEFGNTICYGEMDMTQRNTIYRYEEGIVKFFNKEKGFMFLKGKDEYEKDKDIFTHYNLGRTIIKSELNLSNPPLGIFPEVNRIPKDNEEVVFIRQVNEKGFKAIAWAFKDDFDKSQPHYCVFGRRTDMAQNQYRVLLTNVTVDRIKIDKEYTEYWFKKESEFGWLECPDPRFLKETKESA